MMQPDLNRDSDLMTWLRQNDPAGEISPARLANLSERILQKTAITPQSEATPRVSAAAALSRAQNASLMMGGLIMLVLGLFVGQNLPTELSPFVAPSEQSAALLASPWLGALK